MLLFPNIIVFNRSIRLFFPFKRYLKYYFNTILGILILMILLPVNCGAERQIGPLGVLNQFPPHMMFLTPRPHSPQTISAKRFSAALSFDYFSIYSNAFSSDHSLLMDMEAMVLDFRLAYSLTDEFLVGIRIPMVSMTDGFMDKPLEWYHKSLGLPNYGKEERPKDEFAYNITKDGQSWFEAKEGGLNLLDSTFFTQINLIDLKKKIPTRIGLTYEVKLPVGDETSGFGSGAWDHGFFIPIQFSFSRINTYLMPGYIFIGNPKSKGADISVRDIKSFFIGGEFFYSSKLSFLAQINSYTSPIGETGIEKLDVASIELALGLRWAFSSQLSAELAFCEDLTRSAPDFNLHAMVVFKLP
jgi:hypothetical protein